MSKTLCDPSRSLKVYDEVDVLVCGGGPAGFAAAVAAARSGAKTLLIEQTNCLGGIATAGGHGHLCLYSAWASDEIVVSGIAHEMMDRVVRMGMGTWDHTIGKTRGREVDFEVEGLKRATEEIAGQCGVKLLYHTLFADALVEGGKVIGAAIQNKSGRQAVLAKRVIDATGDADVAASAGVAFAMGRPGDGACQPTTLMFTIGGIDHDKLVAFRTGRPDRGYENVWKQAQEAGDMEPFQSRVMGFWWTPARPDQIQVNFTHIVGTDCTNAASITAATIEGRRQAFHMIPVFRKYIGGFENCYLISTAALLGTRESRRIVGDVVLTEDHLLGRATWPDSVCYGSFFIDIHNCTGPGMDKSEYRPEPGFRYQIPYRCMLPKAVDNLLVAGRCVSVTHRALGSTRVMPQCAALGEAAGAAAALSIQAQCTPRELSVAALQDRLRLGGAIVDEDGIRKANA